MRRALFALVLFCLAAGVASAGEPITIGETITLPSKIMGEERTILVSTPPGYEQSSQSYPVLYMTDGNAHLSHTRGTVDFLARNGLMPQVIVVGVNNTDRTRDLSPTHIASRTIDGRVFESPTSGGASKFLDFFEQELFPYVDANYRTMPLRLFTGHSFGGLFALNAFFTRPEMFDAVLAVSPSLNWDEDFPIRQAKSFLDGRDELNETLFVAMANEEEGDPAPTLLDRLEQALAAADAEGFDWEVMRMPDETHGSVVLRAHYWGLRYVFEPWRLPRDPETGLFGGDLADLKEHYDGLSKRYGYTIPPPEDTINVVAYGMLGRGEVDEAIVAFRYDVELYPDSANVYDSLGDGLVAADRLEEALASYSKAVENATKAGDERLPIFTANRDRVKEQLENAEPE
jgi:predicted alpha/beta superfamily hydrolase